jgi:SAM-dependent methyltransferase
MGPDVAIVPEAPAEGVEPSPPVRFPGERQLRRAAKAVGLGYVKRFLLRLWARFLQWREARRDARMQALYGAEYFAGAEQRQDGVSGYGNYTRATSNADVAAYLLWRFLPFTESLDVGCAKGFVVEALVELGYDAKGWDVSRWAVEHADEALKGRLSVVDLSRRQWTVGRPHFDLVTAFEVLEHLEPAKVPKVLRRLRKVSDGYLVATIPSIGTNPSGPDGFPAGKVRPERVEHYDRRNADITGPVPFEDLARDHTGAPAEGHLTIAPYSWWTAQFERAGFVRQPAVEQAMHAVIGRFDLSVAWSLYVFHVDGREPAPMVRRSEAELSEAERRWHLAEREITGESRDLTLRTVGPEACDAIDRELEASRRRRVPPA